MLNPLYVTAPSLQEYFVDKDTGAPLSQGKVFFYRDTNRAQPKTVFELQGNASNYTYSPLPNPVILSAVGTMADNNGNDILPYYYPYDSEGNQDLYYIVVQNSLGVPQFVREAWPNPNSGVNPSANDSSLNYIPNGQFWAHTDLPNVDNELVAGENILAQGGFSIVLDNSISSVNTLTFVEQPYTEDPNQSPRYVTEFICVSPNPVETTKIFRIKFVDVNKFSAPPINYTFAFWAQSVANLSVSVNVNKNFGVGGSTFVPVTQSVLTLTPAGQMYNVTVNFGSNAGYNIGTGLDWVSIDIVFPTSLAFDVKLVDFVLEVDTDTPINQFPVQSSADMIARGVFGWAHQPDTNGFDLYLPPLLTRWGMAWDRSQIGKIYADVGAVPATNSSLAISNDMPMDGSSYLFADYSYLGIPYARLGNALIAKSPVPNYPLFGTGSDFASALPIGTDEFILVVNSPGTPIINAGAGTTSFTISPVVSYAGTSVGAATINFNSSPTVNFLQTVATNFRAALHGLADGAVSVVTSGFVLQEDNPDTGLYAQNLYGFGITTSSASSLAVGSGTARSFLFSNASIDYVLYYVIGGVGATPAVGSRVSIVLSLDSTITADGVAMVTAWAINSLQMTILGLSAVPTASQYFTFQANPAAPQNYYVWYSFTSADVDPAPSGIGIKVSLNAGDTVATTITKTILAINSYQFAVANFDGMFLRGRDEGMIWDLDADTRTGFGLGIGGANFGTYEYQQFLSHNHAVPWNTFSQGPYANGASAGPITTQYLTLNTGGSETRPVNAYVNWIIKY